MTSGAQGRLGWRRRYAWRFAWPVAIYVAVAAVVLYLAVAR